MIPTCLAPSSVQQNIQFLRISKNFDIRKNWFPTGSVRACKRAAAIQSFLATAEFNGLDPAA